MPQLLHLLIVDRTRRAALASRYGQRWLLPVLACPERARVDPFITQWLATEGVAGNVAGRWLGRLTPAEDGVEWLVAIDASRAADVSNAALIWTALEELVSSPSVVEYQQWAVSASLRCRPLPSVPGPFGNLTWIDEVSAWIGTVTGARELGPLTAYRLTAHEVVLGAEVPPYRTYFKGLPPERAVEIRLTQALSNVAPQTFAQTLAMERRPDGSMWWLMSECPGRDMAGRSDPAMTANIGRALARVQQESLRSSAVLGELAPVPLEEAAAWATDLLQNGLQFRAIERACADVLAANVPRTWIPLDLDPANVLVDDRGRVSFIDLDDSFFGPAPLAMAMFGRCSRNRWVYESYEEACPPLRRRVDWRAFELGAAVLAAWLSWKRVVKNTERREVHGVLEVAAARLARRLTMDITGRR